MNIDQLDDLVNIVKKATEFHDAGENTKRWKAALDRAYRAWKAKNDIGRVDRDSDDWERMMSGTKREYEMMEKAKRQERNARARLATAINRHRGRATP